MPCSCTPYTSSRVSGTVSSITMYDCSFQWRHSRWITRHGHIGFMHVYASRHLLGTVLHNIDTTCTRHRHRHDICSTLHNFNNLFCVSCIIRHDTIYDTTLHQHDMLGTSICWATLHYTTSTRHYTTYTTCYGLYLWLHDTQLLHRHLATRHHSFGVYIGASTLVLLHDIDTTCTLHNTTLHDSDTTRHPSGTILCNTIGSGTILRNTTCFHNTTSNWTKFSDTT